MLAAAWTGRYRRLSYVGLARPAGPRRAPAPDGVPTVVSAAHRRPRAAQSISPFLIA